MGQNSWFSEPKKNLLVSFHFEPDIPASRQFLFNQYFSICTRDFIARHLDNVAIKWPNDIYIDGKKVAGILIEHMISGDRIRHTIAGIGVNINQDWFPEEIPHPTSLTLETGNPYDVETFLMNYQELLQERYKELSTEPVATEALQKGYLDHLYQLGEPHRYRILGREVEATILGVDEFGRLLLNEADGTRHCCGTKEIVFL